MFQGMHLDLAFPIAKFKYSGTGDNSGDMHWTTGYFIFFVDVDQDPGVNRSPNWWFMTSYILHQMRLPPQLL